MAIEYTRPFDATYANQGEDLAEEKGEVKGYSIMFVPPGMHIYIHIHNVLSHLEFIDA